MEMGYLVLPVLSIKILQVSGQSFTAMQLYWKIDWSNVRVIFVLLHLLFHSRVDEVQSCCPSLKTQREREKKNVGLVQMPQSTVKGSMEGRAKKMYVNI